MQRRCTRAFSLGHRETLPSCSGSAQARSEPSSSQVLGGNQGFDVARGRSLGKDGKKLMHRSLLEFNGRSLGDFEPPHS